MDKNKYKTGGANTCHNKIINLGQI